jgi:hypothetical protein
VSIPLWALVHLPVIVTLSTAAFTPNGWVHSILYVLFENAMGIVKLGAVIAGRDYWPTRALWTALPTLQLLHMFLYTLLAKWAGERRSALLQRTLLMLPCEACVNLYSRPACLLAGMLDLKGAHEWVVTTKLGSSDVRPGTTPVMTSSRK